MFKQIFCKSEYHCGIKLLNSQVDNKSIEFINKYCNSVSEKSNKFKYE